MDFYIDTEFEEGFTKAFFRKPKHFIELISVGIVASDGQSYYAISKDFDLDRVWRNDWLRENVLQKIYNELYHKNWAYLTKEKVEDKFNKVTMRYLLRKFGKEEAIIAKEIRFFCKPWTIMPNLFHGLKEEKINFYGYFADYDWVLLCSLFGRMIDLPYGFPMYCRDLKQMQDEISESVGEDFSVKEDSDYPIQVDEHNALEDAKWNKELHTFLKKFKDGRTKLVKQTEAH